MTRQALMHKIATQTLYESRPKLYKAKKFWVVSTLLALTLSGLALTSVSSSANNVNGHGEPASNTQDVIAARNNDSNLTQKNNNVHVDVNDNHTIYVYHPYSNPNSNITNIHDVHQPVKNDNNNSTLNNNNSYNSQIQHALNNQSQYVPDNHPHFAVWHPVIPKSIYAFTYYHKNIDSRPSDLYSSKPTSRSYRKVNAYYSDGTTKSFYLNHPVPNIDNLPYLNNNYLNNNYLNHNYPVNTSNISPEQSINIFGNPPKPCANQPEMNMPPSDIRRDSKSYTQTKGLPEYHDLNKSPFSQHERMIAEQQQSHNMTDQLFRNAIQNMNNKNTDNGLLTTSHIDTNNLPYYVNNYKSLLIPKSNNNYDNVALSNSDVNMNSNLPYINNNANNVSLDSSDLDKVLSNYHNRYVPSNPSNDYNTSLFNPYNSYRNNESDKDYTQYPYDLDPNNFNIIYKDYQNLVHVSDNNKNRHIITSGKLGSANYVLYDTGLLYSYNGTLNNISKALGKNANRVTSFEFKDVSVPKNAHGLFANLNNLQNADLSGLDFSDTTDASNLLSNDDKLVNVYFPQNYSYGDIRNMSHMLSSDMSLQHVDISNMNEYKANDLSYMFSGDKSLRRISGFNCCFSTNDVTNMSYMFYGDQNLQSIDLSGVNSSNVHNMHMMFAYDPNLKYIVLGDNFDTSNVNDFSGMFEFDPHLSALNLGPNFNTKSAVSMWLMFFNDKNLNILNLGPNFNPSVTRDNNGIFNGCTSLQHVFMSSNTWLTYGDDLPHGDTAWYNRARNSQIYIPYHSIPGGWYDYLPQVHDHVEFQYNGKLVGTKNVSGNSGQILHLNNDAPAGYTAGPDPFIYLDNGYHPVGVTPLPVSQTVNFVSNHKVVGHTVINGMCDSKITNANGFKLPHYYLAHDGSENFNLAPGVHNVNVTPKPSSPSKSANSKPSEVTTTINFVYKDSPVYSTKISGVKGQAITDANHIKVDNYHLANDGTENFKLGAQPHNVNVLPDQESEAVNYIDADGHVVGNDAVNGVYGASFYPQGNNLDDEYHIVFVNCKLKINGSSTNVIVSKN